MTTHPGSRPRVGRWLSLALVCCASWRGPVFAQPAPLPADARAGAGAWCGGPGGLDAIRPLRQIGVDIRLRDEEGGLVAAGEQPVDCSGELFVPAGPYSEAAAGRACWPQLEFRWAPAELFHQPLYFDDAPLERYGQTCHPRLQPWISGARFFGAFPLMPYKLAVNHTHEPIAELGYFRPGSPAPPVRQWPPWELNAALVESGAWLAAIAILP